ncbi:hypothetical protein PR202_ga29527 [Eleusine coracana subsp. coracana]|uniref:Uncharacterized protein n=1 Tax=Eleusine coracana subsp. coracana TaxID=191504 RepID=A0AAV5DLU7_ELECO|nr:hypothetical protein PR202_ga29527 [Eleusine coracana subsp. coracana]
MAKKSTSSSAAVLLLAVLVAAACLAQLGAAARPDPVPAAAEDVKRPDTFQEGTVLIPGLGRYEIGSHYIPDITGLDHSIPAAVHGQYLPGADDTWVPNPGFEVPNPFRPGSATP